MAPHQTALRGCHAWADCRASTVGAPTRGRREEISPLGECIYRSAWRHRCCGSLSRRHTGALPKCTAERYSADSRRENSNEGGRGPGCPSIGAAFGLGWKGSEYLGSRLRDRRLSAPRPGRWRSAVAGYVCRQHSGGLGIGSGRLHPAWCAVEPSDPYRRSIYRHAPGPIKRIVRRSGGRGAQSGLAVQEELDRPVG
jgi:hypothetical protein